MTNSTTPNTRQDYDLDVIELFQEFKSEFDSINIKRDLAAIRKMQQLLTDAVNKMLDKVENVDLSDVHSSDCHVEAMQSAIEQVRKEISNGE